MRPAFFFACKARSQTFNLFHTCALFSLSLRSVEHDGTTRPPIVDVSELGDDAMKEYAEIVKQYYEEKMNDPSFDVDAHNAMMHRGRQQQPCRFDSSPAADDDDSNNNNDSTTTTTATATGAPDADAPREERASKGKVSWLRWKGTINDPSFVKAAEELADIDAR
jgi:hypothetical protein